jgi:hypothetical protein
MANILPTSVLPSFKLLANGGTAPSEGIFIPLSSLTGLTSAEANESTGDGRKVAYEVVKALYSSYVALSDVAKPAHFLADLSPPVGLTADTVRRTYTLSFDLNITGSDVTPES